MGNGDKTLLLLFTWSIGMIITGAFTGYGISELSRGQQDINVEPTPVEVTENRTLRNVTNVNNYNDYSYDYTNFQAPHIQELEYQVRNGELVVQDVDFCGELYGSSMQVAIWDDNTVCFREYTGQELSEGQIIRYKHNDTYAIHAVTGNYQKLGYVHTRGYNTFEEERVQLDRIRHVSIGVLYS